MDDEADAATLIERGLDTGLPLAGPGAPLISDFAVMELSALLGRSLDSGRNYVGQVIELAHRLPRTWARVLDGQVPVWKALRVADHTRLLPEDAAAFVDRQLAPYAHGCSWAQVDRLVEEALVRFDPAAAEERRRAAQDHRHVDLGLDSVGYDGIAHGTTALDAADALDLEQAIARRAKLNGQLGDTDSLDVRRAKALGEIAREDLALDLQVADPETGEITRTLPGRKTELILHLSATDQTVGRFGNTRTPISRRADQDLAQPAEHQRDRAAGDRPQRRPSRGLLRDPRPDPLARSAARSPLRVPLLHPAGRVLRPRPHRAPHRRRRRRQNRLPQPVPRMSRAPPDEDRRPRVATGCSSPAPTTGPCPSGTYLVDPTGTYQLTGSTAPDPPEE